MSLGLQILRRIGPRVWQRTTQDLTIAILHQRSLWREASRFGAHLLRLAKEARSSRCA